MNKMAGKDLFHLPKNFRLAGLGRKFILNLYSESCPCLQYQLYRSLGMNVVLDEPPEAQRLQLLNDVWKVVMKLNSPEVILRMS
jgi:hypothetical protein